MALRNNNHVTIILIIGVIIAIGISCWYYSSREIGSLFSVEETQEDSGSEDRDLTEAIEAYEAGFYPEAIDGLESYLAREPFHTDAWFLLGLSCLETGQEGRAIEIMDEVRINDPDYYIDATWYLGLSYLKTNQLPQARIVMEELATGPDSFYQAKAQIVLNRFL